MNTQRKKKLVAIALALVALALYGVWFMNTRVYIDSAMWNGTSYDQTDVTEWVSAGGKIVERNGRPVAVVLKTEPTIESEQAWKLIKVAFARVKKVLTPQESTVDIEGYDFKANTEYLQSESQGGGFLSHEFATTYQSPTGQTIVLYPHIRAQTDGSGKAGELEVIFECSWGIKCPEVFVNNSELDFLLEPDKY